MQRLLAIVTALCVLGCTSTAPVISTVPSDLELGRLGERTAFERDDTRVLAAAPTPGPAPAGPPPAKSDPTPDPAPAPPGPPPPPDTEPSPPDTTTAGATAAEPSPAASGTPDARPAMQPDAPLHDPGEPDKRQRARKALFWTGIVFTAIGGAGTIGFAAAGEGTENQLANGYEDGTLTRARDDQLRTRGEIMNGLAIGSAGLTLVGIAFAAIAYGVDYTRCGTLAKRRRRPCKKK
jgi:hypothetical protein